MQNIFRNFICKTRPYGQFITRPLGNLTREMISAGKELKPIESAITTKLSQNLKPEYLEIVNESYMHNAPKGSETHFKVVVVSKTFENVALIQRHRMINDLLKNELANGVHALSIVAKTPDQWESSEKIVSPSPACRGGFGK